MTKQDERNIAAYLAQSPTARLSDVAKAFRVSVAAVKAIRAKKNMVKFK